MATTAAIRTFTWNAADAAGTTYDVNFGFTPKAVILVSTGAVSADGMAAQTVAWIYGIGVSSSSRRSVSHYSLDGSGNAALLARHSAAAIFTLPDTTSPGGADSDGDLDIDAEANWPANSVRFIVDTQAASANVYIVAIGLGGDVNEAAIVEFQEPGATGDQTVAHGLGGTPKGAIFMSVGVATAPPIDTGTLGMLCIGVTDFSTHAVTLITGNDGNGTMDNISYARTGECLALGIDVTTDAHATCTADGTNLTLNWTERASTRYCFGLVWRGGQFKVSSGTTATDTTQFDGPTNSFVSKLTMFGSACRAADASDTPSAHSQLSLGAATSSTERFARSSVDLDGPTSSECAIEVEGDEVYSRLDRATGTVLFGLMDVVDLTVDPMQLVMDDADPDAAFFWTASWGDNAAAGALIGHLVGGQLTRRGLLGGVLV